MQADRPTINDSRLLDPNILAPTYEQLQQIRNYYGFPPSLDVDRYPVDAKKPNQNKQINVVAAREIDLNGLSPNQQNWINEHLVYTHGNGFVAAPANKSDDQGRPIFTERDVPPTGQHPHHVNRSGIYFGELSPQYSVVHTKQREVNGPGQGAEEQATNTYEGTGGVSIGSLFRQVLFAFRFGEKNLVLSGDLTSDSRILYIRNPRDRVEKVAPYLTIDGDPYPAVINGRVTWILDGYTTSDGYPYSERADLRDVTSDALVSTRSNRVAQASSQFNYIRNSVKATVDAYDGTVTLYAFDPQDPVLQTWMKIFPGTVKPLSDLQANKAPDGAPALPRGPVQGPAQHRGPLPRRRRRGLLHPGRLLAGAGGPDAAGPRAPAAALPVRADAPAVVQPVQPDVRAGGQQTAQHVRVHVRQQRPWARLRQDPRADAA